MRYRGKLYQRFWLFFRWTLCRFSQISPKRGPLARITLRRREKVHIEAWKLYFLERYICDSNLEKGLYRASDRISISYMRSKAFLELHIAVWITLVACSHPELSPFKGAWVQILHCEKTTLIHWEKSGDILHTPYTSVHTRMRAMARVAYLSRFGVLKETVADSRKEAIECLYLSAWLLEHEEWIIR